MMPSGMRDRLITFQMAATVKDSEAGTTTAWVDLTEQSWANERPLKPQEVMAGNHVMTDDVRMFTVLHRTDVVPGMRISHDGLHFEIIGRPIELGRREELQITAKAVG